jgi:hypothetical protein
METISIPGAELYYDKNFLPPAEATSLFNLLREKCVWERRKSSFKYAVPRDEAYYGEPGTNYTYSRREYKPHTWIPELLAVKTRVEEATPELAMRIWAYRDWATTPYSAIYIETE